MCANCLEKFQAVDRGNVGSGLDKTDKVLGHNTVIQRINASLLQLVCKCHQLRQLIKLASLAQSTRPSEMVAMGLVEVCSPLR